MEGWRETVEGFKNMAEYYISECMGESMDDYEILVQTKRLPWGYERKYLVFRVRGEQEKEIIRKRIDEKRLFLPLFADYLGELELELMNYLEEKYAVIQEGIEDAEKRLELEKTYLNIIRETIEEYRERFAQYGLEIFVDYKGTFEDGKYHFWVMCMPRRDGQDVEFVFDGNYEDAGTLWWDNVPVFTREEKGQKITRSTDLKLFEGSFRVSVMQWAEYLPEAEIRIYPVETDDKND